MGKVMLNGMVLAKGRRTQSDKMVSWVTNIMMELATHCLIATLRFASID